MIVVNAERRKQGKWSIFRVYVGSISIEFRFEEIKMVVVMVVVSKVCLTM